MTKLIIDAVKDNIFFMIMSDNSVYSITHENIKINYEKLFILVTEFLRSHNLEINDINLMYINRGPGSFAGIRNSLSMIKAIHMINKIDYYSFSFKDFDGERDLNYKIYPICVKNLK